MFIFVPGNALGESIRFERVELTSVEGGRFVARGLRTRSVVILLERRILDYDFCPVSLSSNSNSVVVGGEIFAIFSNILLELDFERTFTFVTKLVVTNIFSQIPNMA